MLSTFVLNERAEIAPKSPLEIRAIGIAVNCSNSHSATALQECISQLPSGSNDPIWVFLPVRWTDIEDNEGEYDWTTLDSVLNSVEGQGWEPILTLHTVPAWLASKEPRWDRDSSNAVSSFPAEFAIFSRLVAERFGQKVRMYQLDTLANGSIPGFDYTVNPVRYGQMALLAIPSILAADPDAILVAAPLLPAPADSQAYTMPEQWLHRLAETGAVGEFDLLLWQPDPARVDRNPIYVWSTRTPSQIDSGNLNIWSLTATEDPLSWHVLKFSQKGGQQRDVGPPYWPWNGLADRWGWEAYLVLLFFPLLLAAGWSRSVPQWTRSLQIALSHLPQEWKTTAWLISSTTLLISVFLVPSWIWAAAPLILLSGLALGRPSLLLFLTLAVLPLHHLHANFTTPFQAQTFSLSPSHILTIALTPAVLSKPKALLQTASRGDIVWLLGGWFLLLFFGGLGVADSSFFSQWVQTGFFPGWLAMLTLGIGLNRNKVKICIASLAAGVSLFGVVALTQWSFDLWSEKVNMVRLSGLTFSPNHAAMLLERGLWLLLPLVLIARGRLERSGWLSLTALVGGALLLTFSRGALTLGLIAGILAFWLGLRQSPFPMPRRVTKKVVLTSLAIAVAIGLGISRARVDLWSRLLDPLPVAARMQVWSHTWELVKTQIWLGLGVDGFYRHAAAFFPYSVIVSPDISHAHNVWLEILSRWGLAGLMWMAGVAIFLFRQHRRGSQSAGQFRFVKAGAVGALSAGFAHAQVDAFWHWPDIAAMNLVLIIGLLFLSCPVQDTGIETTQPSPQKTGGTRPPA